MLTSHVYRFSNITFSLSVCLSVVGLCLYLLFKFLTGAAKVKKAARITQDRRANPNLFKLADFMPQEVDDSLDVFDDLEDIPEVTSFIQKLKNVVLNAK